MKPPCKTFWPYKSFPQVPLKSSASDTDQYHVLSQQCKPKQLKRYKVFIEKGLKCSEKKQDHPKNEMDIQYLKLKDPGPFT